MGWRDVQAGVASGDISFKPEKDVFGSFASGALGGAIKKRDKEREDAIVAEKERKEQEKLTIKATAEQAKQEKKWKNQALYVMDSLGLQGGANSPDYADIFTNISNGIAQGVILTGYKDQIDKGLRSVDEKGTLTSVTPPQQAAPVYSSKPGDPPAKLAQAMEVATTQEEKDYIQSLLNVSTIQATEATAAAETAKVATRYDDDAILSASPETLVRMRSMAPPERHAAIDAAIAGLPPAKGAQAKYSTMSADDLAVSLALATDATEVALIKKAITARGAIVSDKDLPKVENVRYDNYKAYALSATNAGDAALAAQITSLGEDMVKTRADATGVKLQTGSDSYITTYVDRDGETQTTNTVLTQGGEHFSPDLGTTVAPSVPPLSREVTGDLYDKFIKLKTSTIIPLESTRKDLIATLRSADNLKTIVSRNPTVLTSVGDLVSGVNRIGVEAATLVDMFKSQATSSSVLNYIDTRAQKAQSLEGVAKVAKDVALYEAEILKFAYTFAASGLGQSGQGLSDKDFKAALGIISAGTTQDTFLENLHARVNSAIASTDTVINDFKAGTEVQVLSQLDTTGTLLDSYKRTAEQYARDNASEDIFAWGSGKYVPEKAPSAGGTATTPRPAGSMLITEAVVATTPSLKKWLGKTIYDNNGKIAVWSDE